MNKKWTLSFVMLLVFSAAASAQGLLLRKKLNFPASHGTEIELLNKVAAYSGTVIEYSSHYLDTGKKLFLEGGETTIGNLLELILAGEKINVIEKDNNKIILVPSIITLRTGTLVKKYSLYGFTLENGSKEPLPFAVVKELVSGEVYQSNVYGYYSLNLSEGMHTIEVSYVGHAVKTMNVLISEATNLNLVLQSTVLPEVKVDAGNTLQRDGGSKLEKYQSETYNNILGEVDPVRSLYLLPGNIETQETTGKLIVRGGDPDQSLFLLDGNRVYNPSHLLGEISIVNNTSVKSVRQFKNDFPSRFGDGISSITEVNTKDGNMDKWKGEATVGLLAGAFTVEGPLKKQRTALMFSVRHSWTNPLLNVLDDDYRIRFYDIHFKLTHLLNANNKLMVSGYLGKDHLNLRAYDYQNLQVWGNHLATINWNHLLGRGAFVNTTVNYSNYRNLAGMKFSIYDDSTGQIRKSAAFNNYASIEQCEAKTQFEFHPYSDIQYHIGAKFSRNIIRPFSSNISSEFLEELDYYHPMKPLLFTEFALNGEADVRISPDLLIRPGIYFNSYQFRNYHYNYFQPRFFASLNLGKGKQISLAYSKMGQVLHQVTSPFLGINSEFWVPSTSLLRPVESSMINLGYYQKAKRGINLSADIYYKAINNVTNFAEGGNIFYDEDSWEQDILAGKGWSYGTEIRADRNIRKWSFQLSYALSWSWRKFADINEGKKYPFRYDRRHNISATVKFKPVQNWDICLVWYFNSGDLFFLPKNIPLSDFDNPSSSNPANTDPVNGINFIYDNTTYSLVRGPSYHRLDLNTDFYFSTGKILKHKISAGVYNAYQAKNKYLPDIWNMDNSTYNTTLSNNRLFGLTTYLTYSLLF